jgi:hypothetical protein
MIVGMSTVLQTLFTVVVVPPLGAAVAGVPLMLMATATVIATMIFFVGSIMASPHSKTAIYGSGLKVVKQRRNNLRMKRRPAALC